MINQSELCSFSSTTKQIMGYTIGAIVFEVNYRWGNFAIVSITDN